ncbi:MAG: DUF6351 family protein [Aquihabitans sp.]
MGAAVVAAMAIIAATSALAASAGPDPTQPQSPLLCTTEYNGLGQPKVDNQEKRGTPVYPVAVGGSPDRTQAPLGWSERCQADSQVVYRYRTTSGGWTNLAPGATSVPSDVVQLPVADLIGADRMDLGGATEIPYVIRYQTGTLPDNRFIYSTTMLVPFDEVTAAVGPDGPWDDSYWNERLVFSFGGGVGIGHSQGDLSSSGGQLDDALRLGHAVVYSSGTRTSTHYNLKLGGRTAEELKGLFVAEHGLPVYTVGIGGSGGGIQQYVYSQNNPDLLDALIPQYAYPDMTTQTINIGDCELLEHYMDVTDADNPRWQNWDNRKIIEGQNTIEGFTSDWQALTGATGSSECIEGWRGSTPLALNPSFGLAVDEEKVIMSYIGELLGKIGAGQPAVPDDFPDLGRILRTSPDPADWVEWTHWADAAEVYGIDPATGYARVPWDNIGVQYGLRAVANGTLTSDEFLELNAKIGSWKPSAENGPESCGMVVAMTDSTLGAFAKAIGMCSGDELDQYSSGQMRLSTDPDQPAPRREGDIAAITAAFERGLEFDGNVPDDVPIIDARHYLEDELDMHNVHQSFVTRERIINAQGNADNQLVWFLDARPGKDGAATSRLYTEAFRLVDEWVANIQTTPGSTAAEAKPTGAVDRCWTTNGTEIAAGDDVWSGANELVLSGEGAWTGSAPTEVNGVTVGDCAAHFPLHSTSRIVAGGPITNDVYKCYLKPVSQAIADGDYGQWDPTADEQALLEKVHPNGVCDYTKRSVGYPGLELPPVTTTTTISTTTTTTSTSTTTSTTAPASTSTTKPTTVTTIGAAGGNGDELGSGEHGNGYNDDSEYFYDESHGWDYLPTTGAGVAGLVLVGLALLAAGAVLIVGTRRRIARGV